MDQESGALADARVRAESSQDEPETRLCPEQLLVATTPPSTSQPEHNGSSEKDEFEDYGPERYSPVSRKYSFPTRTSRSPYQWSRSSPPTVKDINPFTSSNPAYRTSPDASSFGQGRRSSVPPNYSAHRERGARAEAEIHPVAVLLALVPGVWKGSKNAVLQNTKMDSMMCDLKMSYAELQTTALSTVQKSDPRIIAVGMHLCRWLGTAVGKHELKILHKVDEANCDAVLWTLLSARTGEFGLAIKPVFKKEPGFVRSLMNKMRPQSKKRRLDEDENAV